MKNAANSKSWGPKIVFGIAVMATLIIAAAVIKLMRGQTCSISFFGLESCENRWVVFLNSTPNEIGDALAGIAGALVLVWVVASVVIQRMELFATVDQMKKSVRIEKERDALREFEILKAQLFKSYFSAKPEEIMYGEWSYRPYRSDSMEHLRIRGRKGGESADSDQDLQTIVRKVRDDSLEVLANSGNLSSKPKRQKEHVDLYLALVHLNILTQKLPSPEQRLLSGTPLNETVSFMHQLFSTQKLFQEEGAP